MNDRLDVVKGQPRSWSQLSEYERCGHAYWLNRVQRAWNRPASWLAQGTGIHEACELWERSGRVATREQVEDWFRTAYVRDLNETLAETPNLAFYEPSGPYKGEADALRRYTVGLEHVNRYIDYYTAKPEEVIWVTPDGVPAIELDFTVQFGSIKVRGKIDAVIEKPVKKETRKIIRDTKSGASAGDPSQLTVYREAVSQLTGVDVLYGDFLLTKRGTPTRTTDLTLVPRSEIIDRFETMDQGVKSEVFTPNPGPNCARCSVRDSCVYREED